MSGRNPAYSTGEIIHGGKHRQLIFGSGWLTSLSTWNDAAHQAGSVIKVNTCSCLSLSERCKSYLNFLATFFVQTFVSGCSTRPLFRNWVSFNAWKTLSSHGSKCASSQLFGPSHVCEFSSSVARVLKISSMQLFKNCSFVLLINE